jgi:hypothetical protein
MCFSGSPSRRVSTSTPIEIGREAKPWWFALSRRSLSFLYVEEEGEGGKRLGVNGEGGESGESGRPCPDAPPARPREPEGVIEDLRDVRSYRDVTEET